MTVGIVGLGLIGGSFARAYSNDGHTVLVRDLDKNMVEFAKLANAASGDLTKENISGCDLVLICLYPHAAAEFLRDFGSVIGKNPVVIDCCGTKRVIFEEGMIIAKKYGFTYLGGHPMAGTQYSGFKYSKNNLYNGAPMVIVPPDFDDIMLLDKVKKLLEPCGFDRISVTTAENHDRMIAFTSQLAHVVSSAYIKSPSALTHNGFSAGSYKDMTRVAWLNPHMWTELFLENKDYLIEEIDILIDNLQAYKDAIKEENRERLIALLEEGKKRKEEVDG